MPDPASGAGAPEYRRLLTADGGGGCRVWQRKNYAYLEQQGIGNYLKYNTFYQDTHRYRDPAVRRAHQFRAENFAYDAAHDTFICPAGQPLRFQYTTRYTSDNGYLSDRRIYQCCGCAACPCAANVRKPRATARFASVSAYSPTANKPGTT